MARRCYAGGALAWGYTSLTSQLFTHSNFEPLEWVSWLDGKWCVRVMQSLNATNLFNAVIQLYEKAKSCPLSNYFQYWPRRSSCYL